MLVAVIWTKLDSFSNFLSIAVCYRLCNSYGLYSHQPQVLTNES